MRNDVVAEFLPDLDAYFAEQGRIQPRYAGQLEAGFQLALEKRYRGVQEPECAFIQTVQLPGERVVQGDWDVRGYEHEFLGNVPLWGKRVLLYGSGSGWIASYIAARAAELVVVDLPPGEIPPLLMSANQVPDAMRQALADRYERLRRGFWFTRQQLGFAANIVYAPFSELPADIGHVDVAILPFVLSLTPDPYQVLKRAAALTGEAIIVTDALGPVPLGDRESEVALAVFAPSPLPWGLVHWWQLSPHAISRMAATLDLSEPACRVYRLPNAPPGSQLFTVVARRSQKSVTEAQPQPVAAGAASGAVQFPSEPPDQPQTNPRSGR